MAIRTETFVQFSGGGSFAQVDLTFDDAIGVRWWDVDDGRDGTYHDVPPDDLANPWTPVGEVIEDYLNCPLVSIDVETRGGGRAVQVQMFRGEDSWRELVVTADTRTSLLADASVSTVGALTSYRIAFPTETLASPTER